MSCRSKNTIYHTYGNTWGARIWRYESPAGVPFNLTGCTFECELRAEDTDILTDSFVIALLPQIGLTLGHLTFSSAVANTWPVGSYLVDLKITKLSGEVRSSPKFRIQVMPGVTR